MKHRMLIAALLATSAFPAVAQSDNQGAAAPNAAAQPAPGQTFTKEVGEAVPTMKAPAGQAEHPPTNRVGETVPPMKPGEAGAGAGAGQSGTTTGPATDGAATNDAAPPNAQVTPPDHQTFTKEVGKAVPTMKSPDSGQPQHPPTKRIGETVPQMKPENGESGTGAASGESGGASVTPPATQAPPSGAQP